MCAISDWPTIKTVLFSRLKLDRVRLHCVYLFFPSVYISVHRSHCFQTLVLVYCNSFALYLRAAFFYGEPYVREIAACLICLKQTGEAGIRLCDVIFFPLPCVVTRHCIMWSKKKINFQDSNPHHSKYVNEYITLFK